MLVLVATTDFRGISASDRNFAVEGELVVPVIEECPDSHCDVCTRAWFGLASHGGTTTAMVAHRPGVTEADLRRAIHEWLDCRGSIDVIVQAVEAGDCEVDGVFVDDPVVAVQVLIDEHIAIVDRICSAFPAGTLLSRIGDLVAERVIPLAA